MKRKNKIAVLALLLLASCRPPAVVMMYDQVQVYDTIINGRILARNIDTPKLVMKQKGDTIHYIFLKRQ